MHAPLSDYSRQCIFPGAHPYISASSTVTNRNDRIESFSLNCPHVADADKKEISIEIVWSLNETVWLKIEDGVRKVINGESTFIKRRVAGKTVMRMFLNNARYMFDYDELTGDFSMEISPVLMTADVGIWQCHVIVRTGDSTHTLTSRRRIRPVEPAHEKRDERSMASANRRVGFAAFSRNSDDIVYITRKLDDANSIVFARNDGPRKSRSKLDNEASLESLRRLEAQIDYELDMNDAESAYSRYLSPPSAIFFNTSPTPTTTYLILIISLHTLAVFENVCELSTITKLRTFLLNNRSANFVEWKLKSVTSTSDSDVDNDEHC
ncbi:unnamed protein product [Caenorhabditis bovis]|uniref:Uncharacterized protein n=1 Tax=Caenorhabditis bovis TaxID=2654633 RepID=A0A8S1EFM8_9PELO|nr:unnamed protein product [Caenorhabditis bovis]